MEGKGTIEFFCAGPDRSGGAKLILCGSYTGEWKNGMKHGGGIFTYPDGTRDAGRFYKDRYTGKCLSGTCLKGKGVLTWADGSRYEGEVNEGMMHGSGTLVWGDGRKYTGSFSYGLRHGRGSMEELSPYGSTAKYEGQWVNGLKHGKGVLTDHEGTYTGEFKNNFISGYGTKAYRDGSKYTGRWKKGKKHGEGEYISAEGRKDTGRFSQDMFQGRCVSGSCLNGTGKAVWSDGTEYTGGFKNGRRHGQGTHKNADGSVKTGIFENGELSDNGSGE
jgi:hypothetical protein